MASFVVEDDDGDEDLQAALALSLQSYQQSKAPSDDVRMIGGDAAVSGAGHSFPSPVPPCEDNFVEVTSISKALQPGFKVTQCTPHSPVEFHSIMWDANLTTDQDKQRWLQERIHIRQQDTNEGEDAATSKVAAASSPSSSGLSSSSSPKCVLDLLVSSHLPWGLVQNYGGPCGVLAAVQAELIRLLLLSVPISVPQPLNPAYVRSHLALAMGWILARAALVPLAEAAPPTSPSSHGDPGPKPPPTRPCAVQVVLPTVPVGTTANDKCLEWNDLEPWNPSIPTSNGSSPKLTCYTIELPSSHASTKGSTALKRPRFVDDEDTHETDEGYRVQRLAKAVASFLETPVHSCDTDDYRVEAEEDKTKAATTLLPLDCLLRSGGVLLFTMSLVATRGTATIRDESDDGHHNRLTSQFGHCSQELINLLLTGQAVSNVFDHTMEVATLICKGISSRPCVGYLSQLEALRYCQVGDYYKTPKHPVWVIGSTSHFSVLFGEPNALKESKSDQLLERCRQAFKRFETDECGFIQTNQLATVLPLLHLDYDDHTVQIIAASIEVSGADIVLWEDFWKTVSRLLMGASVESVLQTVGDDHDDMPQPIAPPTTIISSAGQSTFGESKKSSSTSNYFDAYGNDAGESSMQGVAMVVHPDSRVASHPAAARSNHDDMDDRSDHGRPHPLSSSSTLLSDEELARKLQAEWDAEVAAANNQHHHIDHLFASGTASSVANSNDSVAAIRAADSPDGPPSLSPGSPSLSDTDSHHQGDGTSSRPFVVLPPTPPPSYKNLDTKLPATSTIRDNHHLENDGMDVDQRNDSNAFCLYYYNGLRGGSLTAFRVTKRSAEESVGTSTALTESHFPMAPITGAVNTAPNVSAGGGRENNTPPGNPSSTHSSSSSGAAGAGADLEDVVRTKWPSCAIDWLGNDRPHID